MAAHKRLVCESNLQNCMGSLSNGRALYTALAHFSGRLFGCNHSFFDILPTQFEERLVLSQNNQGLSQSKLSATLVLLSLFFVLFCANPINLEENSEVLKWSADIKFSNFVQVFVVLGQTAFRNCAANCLAGWNLIGTPTLKCFGLPSFRVSACVLLFMNIGVACSSHFLHERFRFRCKVVAAKVSG